MISKADKAKFVAERNAAFLAGDIEWARKLLPNASDPIVQEIAFHKARCAWAKCPPNLAAESRLWLTSRGYSNDWFDKS